MCEAGLDKYYQVPYSILRRTCLQKQVPVDGIMISLFSTIDRPLDKQETSPNRRIVYSLIYIIVSTLVPCKDMHLLVAALWTL